MYDNFAAVAGWRRVDIHAPAHSSSAETKETRTECLWMNYG